jgi:hypothetical protein
MSKATISIFVFGIYAMMAGLGFIFVPHVLLSLFGLLETNEVWVRVVGLFAFFVGGYYIAAARHNLIPFYRASVYFRIPFALCLFLFVLLEFSRPGLAIIGVVDLLAAGWTWWGLRSLSPVRGFAAQETGQYG